MARKKIKWKFAFLLYLVFLNVFTKSLPLSEKSPHIPVLAPTDSIIVEDNTYPPKVDLTVNNETENQVKNIEVAENTGEVENTQLNNTDVISVPQNHSLLRTVRPGQRVSYYSIEITPDGDTFNGRAIISVELDASTREDPVVFNCEGLNIHSIMFGLLSLANPIEANFGVGDGILEIFPSRPSNSYMFLIEYSGEIRSDATGLYRGIYDDNSYLAMNFNPIHARKVFPCMDEPTMESTISFTFNDIGYSAIVGNANFEFSDGGQHVFTAMQGPTHRWGFVAHNFININNPVIGVRLMARAGLSSQENQASIIINAIFTRMEEWTSRPHAEIQKDQNFALNIFAMPDITKRWHALSTICIWEPYILMTLSHAATQRKTAMIEISKAIANQWFGYVIYPQNWNYAWVNTGLSTYSAYEMARQFQGAALETDNTIIDINTAFVVDVIQESLLRDSYSTHNPLENGEEIFDENVIRDKVNGLINFKAPAIMHMLSLSLGQTAQDDEISIIQAAARTMLNSIALESYTSLTFYDAINDVLLSAPNDLIEDVDGFMNSWVTTSNYPVINVQLWNTGVTLTQERFSFTTIDHMTYPIPISYTTSVNPNFDDIAPREILENTLLIPNLFLNEDDWFLCNIQGQGYYRVNYDVGLWERIIEALANPETREIIHPLNRATLLDDALNLARGSRLDYDIALRLVLTMEHETEYAVWKAFVRNMEFIRKRLEALVNGDEDRDQNIYVRMVRRAISSVEREIGFSPDPFIIEDAMTSITRGLVMEHACRAGYDPCIAAAVDWFYDPNSNELAVNPNIPADIRPAVYCTMMQEGDEGTREVLLAKYESETSAYERLIIVRALACVDDQGYHQGLLREMVATGGTFGIEERAEYMKALIESSVSHAELVLGFLRINTNGVRRMFGGSDRLEEIIYVLGENAADPVMTDNFDIWITSTNSNLDDSFDTAVRATEHAKENLVWNEVHMENVYEWIDENDSHTIAVSITLLVFCFVFNILNQ